MALQAKAILYAFVAIDQLVSQLDVSDEVRANWEADSKKVQDWVDKGQKPSVSDFAALFARTKQTTAEIEEIVEAKESGTAIPVHQSRQGETVADNSGSAFTTTGGISGLVEDSGE